MSQKTTDAFVLTAAHGDLPAVKRLAKQVKDVNAESTDGWTALQRAAYWGELEVVQWLVREARADVDRVKSTNGIGALHIACQEGKADVVQFLIEAGADVK